MSVIIQVEASTLVTGTTVDLTARGRVLIPVPPPVVPPVDPPPPDYVPIVIEGEQIPRTTWDDIQIDPARPFGTRPDFTIFRQDTR